MKQPLFMTLPRPCHLSFHSSSHHHARQAGVTLIELMVSLVIGLLVLGGGVGIFLANRETNRDMEALARIHDNARIAFDLMGRSLREAGSNHCGIPASEISKGSNYMVSGGADRWYSYNSLKDGLASSEAIYNKRFLYGVDGGSADGSLLKVWRPDGSSLDIEYYEGTATNGIPEATDSIRFLTVGSSELSQSASSAVTRFFTGTPAKLTMQNAAGFPTPGTAQLFLVCDKTRGIIFDTGSGADGGNFTLAGNEFGAGGSVTFTEFFNTSEFPTNAYITRLVPEYWFIAKNERGGTSLYRTTYSPTGTAFVADEIAPDAIDMQLTYLLRDEDSYKKASELASAGAVGSEDWAKVTAVRIEITFKNFSSGDNTGYAPTEIKRTLAHTVTLRGRNLPVAPEDHP
jgi:type IV pilus assembly protein PilW